MYKLYSIVSTPKVCGSMKPFRKVLVRNYLNKNLTGRIKIEVTLFFLGFKWCIAYAIILGWRGSICAMDKKRFHLWFSSFGQCFCKQNSSYKIISQFWRVTCKYSRVLVMKPWYVKWRSTLNFVMYFISYIL